MPKPTPLHIVIILIMAVLGWFLTDWLMEKF